MLKFVSDDFCRYAEMCKIGTTPQNDWYFFSHKDKKYPTGTRTNRATAAGFWKATGRDKIIYSNGRRIGMRKTLVFYKGRAPHGQKSDWIMHEYRLDDNIISPEDVTVREVCIDFRTFNYESDQSDKVCGLSFEYGETVMFHLVILHHNLGFVLIMIR